MAGITTNYDDDEMRSYQAPETALEGALDKLQKKKKRRDNNVYKSLANMKLKK